MWVRKLVGPLALLANGADLRCHLNEDLARPLAVGAVVAMASISYRGVDRTARVTRVLVALILAAQAVFAPSLRAAVATAGAVCLAVG